jgi:CTP:molybdopterin cytidylyltransferase MocA
VSRSVSAVLLAAGESSRMGDLKALLAWGGRPLIAYQAEQLLAANVERLVVVLGHRAAELRPYVPREQRAVAVENTAYRTGKVSSIVAGAAAAPAGHHVLILAVDQPRPAGLIARSIEAHLQAGAPITIAGYRGRRGHPVVFAPHLRPELLSIDEATQGLRAVLRRHAARVHVVDTDSPLALVNLNTREDYESARRLAGASASDFTSSTSRARAGNQWTNRFS